MFTKRFVTFFLAIVLVLGLGTSILAQNEDSGGHRADNPVVKWLSWLRDQAEAVQRNEGELHLFEPLEEIVDEVAEKVPLDQLNLENHEALNALKPKALGDVFDQWTDALQRKDFDAASIAQWLKQAVQGLNNLFNTSQTSQRPNPLASGLSDLAVRHLVDLEAAK